MDFECEPNVRILRTSCKGQVAQRAEGFRHCSQPFVLQLDDDINLEQNTLTLLLNNLKLLGQMNVVGPVFFNNLGSMPLSPFPIGIKGFFVNSYYFLFASLPFGRARMGRLSSTCVSASIDPKYFKGDRVGVDWLAGGCVLNYRDDIIVDNFFPFDGKAYAEDGLHSYLRAKKGISHYVVLNAKASIDISSDTFDWHHFVQEMRLRFKIVKIMRGSLTRKSIFILAEYIRQKFFTFKK
jgi:glycosyltransferase involved in cell wall biosynthesis